VRGFDPWDDLVEPEQVVSLYADAGDRWAIVLGTGLRGTVESLAPDERERVEAETLAATADVLSVRASAIDGVAVKG
jgi:predicted kinase